MVTDAQQLIHRSYDIAVLLEIDMPDADGMQTHLDFEDMEEACSRAVYKITACGAWLEFVTTNNEERALGAIVGVRLGSIVEGSDAEVGPFTLLFPFTAWEWNNVFHELEDQAEQLWKEANKEHEPEDD